jgi:membrane-bound lytic murein transglycosylase B
MRSRGGRRNSLGSALIVAAVLGGLAVLGVYLLGRVNVPTLTEGRMPVVAYEAYVAAPTVAAGCAVDWTVLAGIAQVESHHGQIDPDHHLAPNGDVVPNIRGAALDGTGGTEPMPDSDAGELDGDATWDRAMGPLQFIPTTWREMGRDGNADGVADPDNLYDAALTAAAHLCLRDPGDYSDRAQLREALVGYNASGRYAEQVLAWVEAYRSEPLEDVVEDLVE